MALMGTSGKNIPVMLPLALVHWRPPSDVLKTWGAVPIGPPCLGRLTRDTPFPAKTIQTSSADRQAMAIAAMGD